MTDAHIKKNGSQKAKKLEHPAYVSYEHLDSASEVGLFYGFTPLALPHMTNHDSTEAKAISEGDVIIDHDNHEEGATIRLEEKIALLHLYEREKMASLSQPIMLSYKKPFVGDRRKANPKESHHGLEIIGSSKSIAEAILLQASLAILSDAGETDLHVEINSIGDKESLSRFTRELTAYYRKHMSELSADCKQHFKKNVFSMLACDDDTCKKLSIECPKSINFLSEKSRVHFKEVLEYLEALDVPYIINNGLVANRDYCGETIFEIRGSDPKGHPKAIGIRYDTLAKRLGHKKEIPAVGVTIAVSKKAIKSDAVKTSTVRDILNPQIVFMQLGFEAKLKSLRLIEALRQARIPVMQSLAKDKMAGQVGMAEKTQAPIVVIMGKKEAMEDSVIVRETSTRSQDTVRLGDVVARLRKYKV
ncbi:MAG: His/Gly/Thr/Pro-type tRNA ligase C-terminal domain-containing protein [Candidatus Paceibacterota bacterium]|jgi:histidyl-tRNA synthetase